MNRREDADAYRARLEHDVRQAMLHGAGGKAQGLTVADTGLLYMNRPGGLKSYDLWRLDQLNDSRRRLPRCEGRGGSSPEVGIVGFDCRNGLVMVHQTALPPTLAPRLVSRQAAAAYVCVSPNTFDEMIEDGRMPRPKMLGGKRRAWDIRELDAAIDRLPVQGDDAEADDTWGNVDAT